MSSVIERHIIRVFVGVAFLLVLQVGWWAYVFVEDVDQNKALRLELAEKNPVDLGMRSLEIATWATRRKWMFLSESLFFVVVTGYGLFLLSKAVRSEIRSRTIQQNFLEIITHESKTPLTALKLRLESLLEKKTTSTEETDRDVNLALEEVTRLSSILEKALNLNRIERQALHFEVVDFSEVIRQALRRLEHLIFTKKAKLALEVQPALHVRGDALYLQNLVQNLIENSLLYNQNPKPEIRLEAKGEGSKIIFRISDNGEGIEESDRVHLFEKFYRGKRVRRIPGTGLGLYIAKGIAEAHQGAIRFVQGRGGSPCFQIDLPAAGA